MGCGASVPNAQGQAQPIQVQHGKPAAVAEAQGGITFQARDGTSVKVLPSAKSRASLEALHALDQGLDQATPEQVLKALLDGNQRFLDNESAHPHQDFQRLQQIAPHQKPHSAILGCADSRVPPEIMFDQGFGDVFVCRVAGNLATAEEIASLEYSVLDLGVKVIMILGHTRCGAVKAALSGKAFPGFIDTLVDHLDVAITRVDSLGAKAHAALKDGTAGPDILDKVVRENVKYQVQRTQRSVIIQEALQKRKLMLVGAVYDLDTGTVQILSTKGGSEE